MAGISFQDAATTTGFHTRPDGFLYCDDVRIAELHHQLTTSQCVAPSSPAFVYSRRQLEHNVRQYREAIRILPVPAELNFSMKSNYNLHILKLLRSLGCGVTLVSGMEQRMALQAGFEPQRMLLNGSGKVPWEIEAAVKEGILLNIDSEFDLQQIIGACRKQGAGTTARALLRLNLDIDPKVHIYVSTGRAGSKFGLDPAALSRVVMQILKSDDCPVRVEGLHCHLGSTIKYTDVFRESVKRLLTIRQELKTKGLKDLNLINVGGGLGIDYTRDKDLTQPYREEKEEVKEEFGRLVEYLEQQTLSQADEQCKNLFQQAAQVVRTYVKESISRYEMDRGLCDLWGRLGIEDALSTTFPGICYKKPDIPTPADLIRCVADVFVMPRDDDVRLIFEPGRSIVGNAGVLMTTMLGLKTSGSTKFLIVDGAMNDVIRPSLYDAYHHIYPAAPPPSRDHDQTSSSSSFADVEPVNGYFHVVDVVGPICESGDFLGKDRLLPVPRPGVCVVLYDAGAYCSSMSSNYNLRPRPAELMVDGSDWDFIRRPDTLEDLIAPYQTGIQAL